MSREWLVTNGIGGYAMGTVAGACTRAYHGYLVAATDPPVGRTLLLQHLDEHVYLDFGVYGALSADEWADRAPDEWDARVGVPALEAFALDGTMPVWTYDLGDARLEKRVWVTHGQNTTYIRYTLLDGDRPALIQITPGINDRDHHGASRDDGSTWRIDESADGLAIFREGVEGPTLWRLMAVPQTRFDPDGRWSRPLFLRVEDERGLTSEEQRFEPGTFEVELRPGDSWTLIATTESPAVVERDPARALQAERERLMSLIQQADAGHESPEIQQLILAADQFIVDRAVQDDSNAHSINPNSIIAGYPWFGDWGRDTMISLPGLCLTTHRYDDAARILRTFARFVSEGMLPNRFPDVGEEPEYNTVDATLWYFWAIDRYLQATGDESLLRDLFPTLSGIIQWHVRGTRYGIAVDPADGLLRAGEPGAQLTWMDVRIDDWVVTPRHGKAVEINALWYRSLRLMAAWSAQIDDSRPAFDYAALADQVQVSFGRFWYAEGGYLYDVIDTPGGADPALRPNQVLAIAVAPDLLDDSQIDSALSAVTHALWTPLGLRTLAPGDPHYQPRFTGDRVARDSAYHQGTVWPWLIGHYLDARHRRDPGFDARPYVQPLLDHLWDAGLGTISEVFDADPPRFGAGCPSQAWSVAEVLRAARDRR